MPVGQRAHRHPLFPSVGAADFQLVTDAHQPVRFCALTVDVDLSAFARLLRFRTRSEQAGDVEPDIESDLTALLVIDHIDHCGGPILPIAQLAGSTECVIADALTAFLRAQSIP
jgi:hypothetical protein